MAKKNTIKINNALTGKAREIALPSGAEEPTQKQSGSKQEGSDDKNKR